MKKNLFLITIFFTITSLFSSCSHTTDTSGISLKHSFIPHPLIKNAHLQTVIANYYGQVEPPPSQRDLLTLPDGDQIALEISTPNEWTPNCPTILILHGLGGSHNSPYLKRLTYLIIEKGARAVRMNFRGCGSGKGLAKRAYHGGLSEDIKEVILSLNEKHPQSSLSLIGFSLGGGLTLKLLGEDTSIENYLEKAIAVCPAICLEDSAIRFQKFSNTLYQRSFLRYLTDIVKGQNETFSDELLQSLEQCKSIYEFDEIFTAPYYGFENAKDYYTKCSSKELIPNITVKTHILFAKDDPLVNGSLLNPDDLPDNIELIVTEKGGHMGFLGNPKKSHFRWMDHQILTWLELN